LRIGVVVGVILFLIQVFLRNPALKRTSGDGQTSPERTPRRPTPNAAAPSARNGTQTAATPTPSPSATTSSTSTTTWVEPEDGVCPPTHPVKVKLASGIFHVPGGLAYDRTTPDRCYRDAAAAEADGFRPAKR
jgi:hypothetical protein